MSSAASSSRTANTACLKARRSTLARKSDSSVREARGSLFRARRRAQRLLEEDGARWYQRPSALTGGKGSRTNKGRFPLCISPAARPRGLLDQGAEPLTSIVFARYSTESGLRWTQARSSPCPNSPAPKSSCAACRPEGVEYVFGYPGGAVLFIYDELFKQDKVKHVLVRHEQGAAHAADGYSRSTQQGRRLPRHLRAGRHQRGDRHRDRLHGLDPDGGHHRPGADPRHRPGRIPGVRHGRHHAARASSTTSW